MLLAEVEQQENGATFLCVWFVVQDVKFSNVQQDCDEKKAKSVWVILNAYLLSLLSSLSALVIKYQAVGGYVELRLGSINILHC